MRMSCNGCRVLRKGCSDDCTIRPCLQWIKSPDSQANATLFLAKSYGRAGLLNLINVGPQHLRPAIFKSLLYEACGRIVNPIYGAVGLLWSGNWAKCQGAVEAVLAGSSSITGTGDHDQALFHPNAHLKACDIRGVPNKEDSISAASRDVLHKVKARAGFKRSVIKPRPQVIDSCLSQENESMFSVETVEASPPNIAKRAPVWEFQSQIEDGEVDLELTLGLAPVHAH